jgi:V/A-type H+-transporting ATPase subunit C
MKIPSRLSYAYAVGRIRALERGLVHRSVFLEAADSADFSHALKIIFDAGEYSREWTDIGDSHELDDFLGNEERLLFSEVNGLLRDSRISTALRDIHQPQRVISLVQKLPHPFILNYLRHKIDLDNIKLFLRLKYGNFPVEKMESRVVGSGFVDKTVFLKSFDLSLSEFSEKLRGSSYLDLWERAIDALGQDESFVVMERDMDTFLIRYLKIAKYTVFGPEPVFAFALAKKMELKLLGFVCVGVLNRIPADMLKGRIGETYA